jgi:hypothetical protein
MIVTREKQSIDFKDEEIYMSNDEIDILIKAWLNKSVKGDLI